MWFVSRSSSGFKFNSRIVNESVSRIVIDYETIRLRDYLPLDY